MSLEVASGGQRSIRTQTALLLVEGCKYGLPEAFVWQGEDSENQDPEVGAVFQRAAELELAGWGWNDIKEELTPLIEQIAHRMEQAHDKEIGMIAAKLDAALNRIYDGGEDE